jgi:hypothetical protein
MNRAFILAIPFIQGGHDSSMDHVGDVALFDHGSAEIDTAENLFLNDVDITPHIYPEVELALERCKTKGYSQANTYLLNTEFKLDPHLERHCNRMKYIEHVLRAQAESPAPRDALRIYSLTSDQTYQDFFQKHVLRQHPVQLSEPYSLPTPDWLNVCFDTSASSSSLRHADPACIAQLHNFQVPSFVYNDFLQRINVSHHDITLPTLQQGPQSTTACPFGLHMLLVSLSSSVSVNVAVRSYPSNEYMVPLEIVPDSQVKQQQANPLLI